MQPEKKWIISIATIILVALVTPLVAIKPMIAQVRPAFYQTAVVAATAQEVSQTKIPGTAPQAAASQEMQKRIEQLISQLSSRDEQVYKSAIEALEKIGQPAVQPLINVLKTEKNGIVRGWAVKILGDTRDKRAIQPLIKALGDDSNAFVRQFAATALAQIGDKQAVQPLIDALADDHWLVRTYSARALGQIGDPRAIQSLVKAGRDQDKYVRQYAAEALDQISAKRADEPLIKALDDKSPDVPSVVTKAVELVNKKVASEEQAKATHQTEAPATIPQTTTDQVSHKPIDELIRQLRDEKPSVRNSAIEALVEIGQPAVYPLIGVLEDEYWVLRWRVSEVLGLIGDPRAVQPLINALADKNEWVRRRAAEALGRIGDEQAIQPLIKALKDESPNVRTVATRALALIKNGTAPEERAKAVEEKKQTKAAKGKLSNLKKYIGVEIGIFVLGGLAAFVYYKKRRLSRQEEFSELFNSIREGT